MYHSSFPKGKGELWFISSQRTLTPPWQRGKGRCIYAAPDGKSKRWNSATGESCRISFCRQHSLTRRYIYLNFTLNSVCLGIGKPSNLKNCARKGLGVRFRPHTASYGISSSFVPIKEKMKLEGGVNLTNAGNLRRRESCIYLFILIPT